MQKGLFISHKFYWARLLLGVAGTLAVLLALSPRVMAASSGDVAITEFMANPTVVSDTNGEWVELKNTTSSDLNITDWDIDGSTISGNVVIAPNAYAVICKNTNQLENDGVICDAKSNFSLTNSGDTITVRDNFNAVVTTLSYTEANVLEGHSTHGDLTIEMTKKYSPNNYGRPAHNETMPPVPGEIRVHHTIDTNRNAWPDFTSGETHYKGRHIRLYKVLGLKTWALHDAVVTTGNFFEKSAKFVTEPGEYAVCEVAVSGYEQTFARSILGWYNMPETGTANLSGVSDEYELCVPVEVVSGGVSSHVFGDAPLTN